MIKSDTAAALPGGELIAEGLKDLEAGRETIPALLVSIGAPRLRAAGIPVEEPIETPEHRLYSALARERGNGAHSAYNALIRRLVSFEHAACAS